MPQKTSQKKQVNNSNDKPRKGDTERTSSQGRKIASGGRTDTNNRNQRKGGKMEL